MADERKYLYGKQAVSRELAIARTVLANERTLLAVLRTALGCSMGGAGLPKFFNHPAYGIAGIFLMMIAALILGFGRGWPV